MVGVGGRSYVKRCHVCRRRKVKMMENGSPSSIMQHLQGVGALLQDCGINELHSAASRRIFYEYRCIDITLCLVTRRASFLSLSEWINPPWKSLDPHSSNYMQSLLDSGFRIPVLLEEFDRIRNIAGNIFNIEVLRNIIRDASSILASVKDWENSITDGDKTLQLYIPHLANFDDSSNDNIPTKTFPIFYDFPTFGIAAAMMYCEMFQIFLHALLIDIKLFERGATRIEMYGSPIDMGSTDNGDLTSKSIECGNKIYQSVQYFFDKSKRMTWRMVILNPFEAARGLFARLAKTGTGDKQQDTSLRKKAKFCERIVQLFQDEELPVWHD